MSEIKATSSTNPEKPEEVSQQTHDLYVATLKEIRKLIPAQFSAKENKSGVTWFGDNKTRLCKLIESKKGIRMEFNVEVPKMEGLTVLTVEEAKEKHMGTCRWIYSGKDIEAVKKLVEHAMKGFEPKKRADSVEQQEKDAAKKDGKADAKKDDKAPAAEPASTPLIKVGGKLSDEEIKKLSGQDKK